MKFSLPLSLVLAMLLVLPADAEEKEPPQTDEQERRIDEKAVEILREARELIREAESFSLTMEQHHSIRAEGMRQELTTRYAIAVEKPNKFAYVLEGGAMMMGGTVISDGEKMVAYMPMFGRYTVSEAPEAWDEIQTSSPMIMGFSMVLGPLLSGADGEMEKLARIADQIEYVGTERVGDHECHHIHVVAGPTAEDLKNVPEEVAEQLPQAPFMIDVWVRTGERPLLCRIRPDLSAAFARMGKHEEEVASKMLQGTEMEITFRFDDWRINPDIPEERFEFKPPPGAEKVDDLFEFEEPETNVNEAAGDAEEK